MLNYYLLPLPSLTLPDNELPQYYAEKNNSVVFCWVVTSLLVSFDDLQSQALTVVFQQWFHISAEEGACADTVAVYLNEVNSQTPTVLQFLVNMADDNGNTTLHYSVSHCNFSIVKLLLDTGQW